MAVDWAGYGYAALVASGGVMGYVKAGSVPSLAAGLLFGGLAGFGAYQTSQDPKNIWVSLGASGTLAAIMGKRFYNSRKIIPAGLIAGASRGSVADCKRVLCESTMSPCCFSTTYLTHSDCRRIICETGVTSGLTGFVLHVSTMP
ncbi:transmembrane protein 14C isoform X1 [Carassius auratus]|uniref:Transmembrane protein 14C n=1 Tax=Carassius auratus TaxID=7957 RepID=A0A6P6J8W2_CARAU|nr:transmembrane protein 14C isoform X1 [Carassius auratus]XP_026056612.1 transmembrane protein 14C isoform X1 [Carassius auratus]